MMGVALLSGNGVVTAQTRTGSSAVFGEGSGAAPATVAVSMTVAEAYDQDLLADAGAAPQPTLQASGSYTWLAPQVTVRTHGSRVQWNVFGVSSLRYYPSFAQAVATNFSVGVGLSAKTGQHTTVTVNQSLNYAPTYLYALFAGATTVAPGAPASSATDYQTDSRSYQSSTSVSVDQALSRRTTVTAIADLQRTNFLHPTSVFRDTQTADVGGHVSYGVQRNVTMRLGVVERVADYSGLLRTSEQDVQFGVTATKELSATRRLSVGGDIGPTHFDAGTVRFAGGQFRTTGDAFVEREFGQSWSARGTYRRGLSYVEGLSGPTYSESATFEASGSANRRTDVLISAGYASGQLAAQTIQPAQITTYMGYTRLRMAVSRTWALYLEGLYYDYAFDRTVLALPGLANHFTRGSVRTGITLWLPLRTEHRGPR